MEKEQANYDPYADDDEQTVFNKIGEGVNYIKDKVLGKNETTTTTTQVPSNAL